MFFHREGAFYCYQKMQHEQTMIEVIANLNADAYNSLLRCVASCRTLYRLIFIKL